MTEQQQMTVKQAAKNLASIADKPEHAAGRALEAILRFDIDAEPADYIEGDDIGSALNALEESNTFGKVAFRQQVRIADWCEKALEGHRAALLAAMFFARCPSPDPVALKVGVETIQGLDDSAVVKPGYVDVSASLMVALARLALDPDASSDRQSRAERAELLRDLLSIAGKIVRHMGYEESEEEDTAAAVVGAVVSVSAADHRLPQDVIWLPLMKPFHDDKELDAECLRKGRDVLEEVRGLLWNSDKTDLSERAAREARPGLSIQEAAKMARRDEATITRWCQSRGIGKKSGGRWVVNRSALKKVMGSEA